MFVLVWHAPWLVFLPGTIRAHAVGPAVAGAPQTAGAGGPAWHPDPTGRSRYRWWDGQRWTDAVSDGASTGTDPI